MKTKVLLQMFFWLIIAGVIIGFSANVLPLKTAIQTTVLHLSFYCFTFYFNSLFTFKKFYKTKNHWWFFILSIIFISITAFVMLKIEVIFISSIQDAQKHLEHLELIKFIRNFFMLGQIIMIGTIYLVQQRLKQQELINKKVVEEKLKTDLKLLKAQINPHFLFNALNNIYSLTYTKSDKAPESVLKLSHMLRYVIDDCVQETVSLKSEIEYIKNFVSFQKIKAPDDLNVELNINDVNANIKLSPLLFIPFIENSFKYSKIEEFQNAFIKISISSPDKDSVEFAIINSIPSTSRAKSGAGTGIKNVKQRLNIIYPDKHTLKIQENKDSYSVSLKILTL